MLEYLMIPHCLQRGSSFRDNQSRYYKAIEKSTSLGESTLFIEFMLEIILQTIKSSVKSSVDTRAKILYYLQQNPKSTISELAELLNLTTRAVEKQIADLKKQQKLHRVGSSRKGYWEVTDKP
jgi:predicted HTH transcriptional regulator